VWIGNVDGGHMRPLAQGLYGVVAPDGATVALARRRGVFVIRPDGSGERFVAAAKPAAWLPDSRHLLAILRKAFVRIDTRDGTVDLIERGAVVAWTISPDGESIAYDVYDAANRNQCGWDVYSARVDGTDRRQLTRGGRSSNPVWGESSIAFAYRPPGTGCFKPRIWLMDTDGGKRAPMMRRLPARFATSGYYGIRPFAWVRSRPLLLATVPTEWGSELALVRTRDGKARKPDLDPRPRSRKPMYVDQASRDGLYVVGDECLAERPCRIWIHSVLDRRSRRLAFDAAYPNWNR
jgi:hypothetical protein